MDPPRPDLLQSKKASARRSTYLLQRVGASLADEEAASTVASFPNRDGGGKIIAALRDELTDDCSGGHFAAATRAVLSEEMALLKRRMWGSPGSKQRDRRARAGHQDERRSSLAERTVRVTNTGRRRQSATAAATVGNSSASSDTIDPTTVLWDSHNLLISSGAIARFNNRNCSATRSGH